MPKCLGKTTTIFINKHILMTFLARSGKLSLFIEHKWNDNITLTLSIWYPHPHTRYPPNCTELHPIEKYWTHMKTELRKTRYIL